MRNEGIPFTGQRNCNENMTLIITPITSRSSSTALNPAINYPGKRKSDEQRYSQPGGGIAGHR